jgi:hypothetical protein
MRGQTGYNLKGFIVGNGITDMYIDTDNPLLESVAHWSMIPMSLWTRIKELGCIFYWKKMDLPANNPPECEPLYNESMTLIQDLDIYDLFRTVYADQKSAISKARRILFAAGYDDMQSYINLPEVRKALNIPEYIQEFLDCNDDMYETYHV